MLYRAAFHAVSKDQIVNAIKQGSIYKQTDGFLAVHGYICVAYKQRGSMYKIKTVFLK